MRVSYQYRIKPDTEQKKRLNSIKRLCQYLYNSLLGERFEWWEQNRSPINACPISICYLPELKDNPNYYSQKLRLPELKKDLILVQWSGELLDLSIVYSQVLQDVLKRVDLAFKRFIKGDNNGKRSGKPRFKSESTFKSFNYPQAKNNWINGEFINLPKIENIEIILHRPLLEGFEVKTCIVSKKADGWYITLSIEDKSVPSFTPDEVIPTEENSLGLDAVLHEDVFLATSDKELIPSRKTFRKATSKLAKFSKKKSSKKKGSKARRKLAKKEAKIHQKIARSRKDHHFNVATELSRSGKKVFFVEDLNLQNLTKRHKPQQDDDGKYLPNNQSAKSGLNKSFLDAGFGQFVDILSYKVEKTGSRVIKVNPSYTSQICSCCNSYVEKSLSERIHNCNACKLRIDRDINAAINVKRVGLGLFPTVKRRKGKSSKSTLKEIQELT